jgi:hypothetical protein
MYASNLLCALLDSVSRLRSQKELSATTECLARVCAASTAFEVLYNEVTYAGWSSPAPLVGGCGSLCGPAYPMRPAW